jgi:DNA-binding CsgD family transcriptional regulator
VGEALDELSPREIEILELIERGMPTKRMGGALDPPCATETVKTHLKRLFRKLGAKTRAEAVAIYRGRDSNN